jgi:hypothetical protein
VKQNSSILFQGRIIPPEMKEPVAFSPREFAALFGKEQTWGYRQIYGGKVKTITDYGRILIPASEVERILGKAGIYNGLKPKVQKRGSKLDVWRKFISDRRKPKSRGNQPAPTARARLPSKGGNLRNAALARLALRQVEKSEG